MNPEILTVIRRIRESREGNVGHFMNGGCLHLCLLLNEIYPEGNLLFNENHFIFEYGNKYYDINGEVDRKNHINLTQYSWPRIFDVFKSAEPRRL